MWGRKWGRLGIWIYTIPLRSAPAQKALPEPVSMPTLIEGSLSIHVQMASRSWWPAVEMLLSAFGRERVTRRTCGCGRERVIVLEEGVGRVGAIFDF